MRGGVIPATSAGAGLAALSQAETYTPHRKQLCLSTQGQELQVLGGWARRAEQLLGMSEEELRALSTQTLGVAAPARDSSTGRRGGGWDQELSVIFGYK